MVWPGSLKHFENKGLILGNPQRWVCPSQRLHPGERHCMPRVLKSVEWAAAILSLGWALKSSGNFHQSRPQDRYNHNSWGGGTPPSKSFYSFWGDSNMQLRLRSTEPGCLSNFNVNTIYLTERRFWFSGSEFGAWASDFLSSSQMLLETLSRRRKGAGTQAPAFPIPASMPQELWFLRHLVVRNPLASPSKRRPDDVGDLPNI